MIPKMKLMDEKGRLFGKLSIIDLLVLLIVIVAAVFLVSKLTSSSGGITSSDDPVTKVYTVKVTEVDPATYEVVQAFVDKESGKKDQLLTGSSLANGYVTDCVATPHVTYVETADGQVIPVESSGEDTRLDLIFTLEATITNTVTNAVGSQEVRAGMPQVVKTAHFELQNGTVLSVEWSYQE